MMPCGSLGRLHFRIITADRQALTIMFGTNLSPSSSLGISTSPSQRGRKRSTSIGIAEPLATHHIIGDPKNPSTLEIQQKGWCQTSKPIIGSPVLVLTTPKVDGASIVAAAKLKSSNGSCKVMLGDPTQVKEAWTQITASASSNELFNFGHEGKRYIWRK